VPAPPRVSPIRLISSLITELAGSSNADRVVGVGIAKPSDHVCSSGERVSPAARIRLFRHALPLLSVFLRSGALRPASASCAARRSPSTTSRRGSAECRNSSPAERRQAQCALPTLNPWKSERRDVHAFLVDDQRVASLRRSLFLRGPLRDCCFSVSFEIWRHRAGRAHIRLHFVSCLRACRRRPRPQTSSLQHRVSVWPPPGRGTHDGRAGVDEFGQNAHCSFIASTPRRAMPAAAARRGDADQRRSSRS
jgi:hypothetical protein